MRHQAFLERLASAASQDDFAAVAAGYKLLIAYDSAWTVTTPGAAHADGLRRIVDDLAGVNPETRAVVALRASATALETSLQRPSLRIHCQILLASFLEYGSSLLHDAELPLAADVLGVVAIDAESDGEVALAAHAQLLRGLAFRWRAEWDRASAAYARARSLAVDAGTFSISLRAQLGSAHVAWMRGDLPRARAIVQRVVRDARSTCPELVPRALLAEAGIANAAGEYERAVMLAFRSLQLAGDDPDARYPALVDLANFLVDVGLSESAAAALELVAAYAPDHTMRVQARLNALFAAAQIGDVVAFHTLRTDLVHTALAPRQATLLALFSAQGFRILTEFDRARDALGRAESLASQYKFHQIAFDVDAEAQRLASAECNAGELGSVPDPGKGRRSTARRTAASPAMRRVAAGVASFARAMRAERTMA